MAIGATISSVGCLSALGTEEPEICFENSDEESHQLVVRIRGDENEEYVHEYERDLTQESSDGECERIGLEQIRGSPFVLETRMDDRDPETHEIVSGFRTLDVVITDEQSISFVRGTV